MTDRDLLTTREACDYLRISRDTLRRLKPKREYVGARPRYRRAELDKVFAAGFAIASNPSAPDEAPRE
jgi:excisionase family DNA binding protein